MQEPVVNEATGDVYESPLITVSKQLSARRLAPWQRPETAYICPPRIKLIVSADAGRRAEELLQPKLSSLGVKDGMIWRGLFANQFRFFVSETTSYYTDSCYLGSMDIAGNCVGCYGDGYFYVSPDCRRRNVASELVLAGAILYGKGRLHNVVYSDVGEKVARKSYEMSLRLAAMIFDMRAVSGR